MANEFYRLPIAGGDNNVWAGYLLSLIRSGIGECSSYLYNDGGTLKVAPGRIGINDGVNSGISIIDTATTVTIAGANGRWYKIEMTVSGNAVTFASTVLADADPGTLPTTLTGSYVGTKQGYYHISTARIIGLVWKHSSGIIGGIVNVEVGDSYSGYSYESTLIASANRFVFKKNKNEIINKGYFYDGLNPTQNEIYDAISSSIPNIGEHKIATGEFVSVDVLSNVQDIFLVSGVYRSSSTILLVTGIVYDNIAGTFGSDTYSQAEDGNGARFFNAVDNSTQGRIYWR